MALESIACQIFNSTSHRIEWTGLSSVVKYPLLEGRIHSHPGHDVMGLLLERIQTMFLSQFRVLTNSTNGTHVFVSSGYFAYRNMRLRLGN